MEALLSVAFDNLSSFDGPKIKKGLKLVEGLLAQICLSQPTSSSKSPTKKPTPQNETQPDAPKPKTLPDLAHDPAFREFFKLQEGFEWNVAQRLLTTLDRLVAKGGDGQNDLLILSALDLIQGVLLLHPPSKALFSREIYMNLLLDLIEPVNCPAIQCATLLTLVVALIDTPTNTRTFEALDGLLAVTSLFRDRDTSRDVKVKLIEFLYFYLMPETPSIPRAGADGGLHRSPSKLARVFGGGGRDKEERERGTQTRGMEDKQRLLSQLLPEDHVEQLVRDLRTSAPFGVVLL
ncbi:putative cell division control protein [Coniochaeta ligniaria NRRL 30616]|uniref:Putative cell division control protein n=1 Tax=Coniochaeta ligniaria NRRL 30616 TaxID=1408157 RepID=A0A1J7I882_9PEZI|nr:putative cell division control protein [Coniochaeta ligniaria NRRL 30616]